jgi:very-short-patch-repair endonuclease
MTRHDIDVAIERLAQPHGAFLPADVKSAGGTRSLQRGRLKRGRWLSHVSGALLVAASEPTWRRELAAITKAFEGVASHKSAAGLLGLDAVEPGHLEVTVRANQRVRPTAATVHRSSDLLGLDVTELDSIRATNGTRTVLDICATVDPDVAERVANSALRLGLTTLPRLTWRLDGIARSGRPGVAQARVVLDRLRNVPCTASDLETLCVQLLRAAGITLTRQYRVVVAGRFIGRVDLAEPSRKLAIEVDGRKGHGPEQFQRDRTRQNDLVLLGWTVLRFTWDDVTKRPDYVVTSVLAALGA